MIVTEKPIFLETSNGLIEGSAYTSEARSWSDIPPCAVEGGQDMVVSLHFPGEGREIASYGGN